VPVSDAEVAFVTYVLSLSNDKSYSLLTSTDA
jgi:hypothetical protein